MFLTISEFIGHFHPVLVHLPIGILLLTCILYWIARRSETPGLLHAVSISLLIGLISAVFSCISGFLLSQIDDYDSLIVGWHQWLGISATIIALMWYLLNRRSAKSVRQNILSVIVFLLIVITGHFGGSLTHGSDYLTSGLNGKSSEEASARKPIANVQEAAAYSQIIQPLLQEKCYSCHGAEKQKGKLRLDQAEFILKGGKNGEAIKAGSPEESELMKRLLLPREDDDHMPPKEKSQLTEQEVSIIHWWISSGASFDKKVKELNQPDKIKPALLALQNETEKVETIPDIPLTPVEKADDSALARLRSKGIVILPVATNSNYLIANFVTASSVTNKDLSLLLPIKKQLVSLKLGSSKISDSGAVVIGQCTALIRLQLNNTAITDQGLASFKNLKELKYINLVGTPVTTKGILELKELKKLQSIYLYHTGIKSDEWPSLKKEFPATQLDTGGYIVPTLESDTTEVKQKPKAK